MTKGPNEPLSLEYAAAPSRRRRWLLQGLVVLVALAVGGAATQYAPAVWTRIRQIYWQRQCMKFTAPAGTIVFRRVDNGVPMSAPAEYTAVANIPHEYSYFRGEGVGPQVTVTEVGFVPQCLVNRIAAFNETGFTASAVAFCHERTSPSGNRRLVTAIYFNSGPWQFDKAFAPFLWDSGGASVPSNDPPTQNLDEMARPIQIEAGQFDPTDASHFTIAYQWPDGVRGIVDGWLGNDDLVKFAIREGPGDVASARARLQKAKIDALKFRDEWWPAN